MVYRIYVEKKEGFRQEADNLRCDLESALGIRLPLLRIINRYDVENISRQLFEKAAETVFSEKSVDVTYTSLPESGSCFAVCPLPGQFDLRSHSAAECISFIDPQARAEVKAAKVYLLDKTEPEVLERIKKYVINPVEAAEDSLDEVETLDRSCDVKTSVRTLTGFTKLSDDELEKLLHELSLAMDADDLACLRDYFASVGRDPTITEIRVCDTYWSDHCRHTTFQTKLENIRFEDSSAQAMYQEYLSLRQKLGCTKPVTLMDAATIGARWLKAEGKLTQLDESEEINACSIRVKVTFQDRSQEDYLLMFKNETHNHPTEIEPFGGAATCIGGAIRDPLSGRAYVYQAMRITGSGDVTAPVSSTLEGKLAQKKIGQTSSAGYSSYGNQIGLATGLVDEIYHPGYIAKHMELGAVVAAAKAADVRRSRPEPGDVVILTGGRTGRDGIGGATGSSKSHNSTSVDTACAEVQKGNAPEERKLQRLFRNPAAQHMIKRCNDFGAGGVAVAIGELAAGLEISLDRVPRKYQGLDGTELAISESQERMAVVVSAEDVPAFLSLAESENLEATAVAEVTEEPVLKMTWAGKTIVCLDRWFLDTNGAGKTAEVLVAKPAEVRRDESALKTALSSLKFCSRQGLAERFDSTIGAGTVIMPFGGRYQKTPSQIMAALIPDEHRRARTASLFSYGFDPDYTEADPFGGAYDAVFTSVAKLVAAGSSRKNCCLSLQEFFGRTGRNPERWGRVLAALLGALRAQLDLETAAIGGKDSMSGTFEDLNVPNTLVSFAINTLDADRIITNDMKKAGSFVYLVRQKAQESPADFLDRTEALLKETKALSACYVEHGRPDVAIARMCFGSMIGFQPLSDLSFCSEHAFIIETETETDKAVLAGVTADSGCFGSFTLTELLEAWQKTLEGVYPQHVEQEGSVHSITSTAACTHPHSRISCAKPRVLIPVFPGTNCEYDTALAFERAGARPETFIINNLDEQHLAESIRSFAARVSESQILFIPGGFSGGDEPDGSGKFITAFMRNSAVMDEIMKLLNVRDGLAGGICNGFQALIKLGLLPYGEFRPARADSPTLTYNRIARHQSKLVETRICSRLSPWLSRYELGQVQMVPVSHGEGRFIASEDELRLLEANGQICTQYTSPDGLASMDVRYNPNGSAMAVEGLCSPDGRVFGRMGHIERCYNELYRNVVSTSCSSFFEGAVEYFR